MKKLLFFFLFLISLLLIPKATASEKEPFSAVYFTGIGCPHCATADPIVLEQLTQKYPHLIVFEYEIYQKQENAPLLYQYNEQYNSGLGIPLIIFGKDDSLKGDLPIIKNIEKVIEKKGTNKFPSANGELISFEDLKFSSLPGKPTIWTKQRVLISSSGNVDDRLLKNLLTDDLSELLKDINFEITKPKKVPLSGKKISFENAIKINDWLFQWNGQPFLKEDQKAPIIPVQKNLQDKEACQSFTLTKILSLAAVDAINPCALAVLTLILLAILTFSPKRKRNVLLAGLAFSAAVFIMYLIYGLVIIKSFQLIQALTNIRLWLYKVLGIGAIILGLLNLKDFIHYKPGGFLTEMPLSLRPKMQNFLFKVTSPKSAFLIGALVTIFLLPCTIGPYVICGGILSSLALIKTIPWLLLYNLIFILPMIAITIICYIGFTTVENVSGWKDKNIRYLHLVSGIIIFLLGLAMLLGWL